MTRKLVLLRHGQSQWNLENRFTGWVDVDLTEQGRAEAAAGGRLMREEGLRFDVAYTSTLKRAIRTLNLKTGRAGPGLAAGAQELAPQRAPLRRAAGPRQG